MQNPFVVRKSPLRREFFARPTELVARELLGKLLVRRLGDQILAGIVVETEAYLPENDPASHSHVGQRPRNRVMFGEPGKLYVYAIHAKYCLNAVTERSGLGSAVLIRALEPVLSMPLMSKHRKQQDPRRLCSGPAMLCQALNVDLNQNGTDLCTMDQVWFESAVDQKEISSVQRQRIGISKGQDLPLRFFVNGNRFVSGRAADHTIPRKESLGH